MKRKAFFLVLLVSTFLVSLLLWRVSKNPCFQFFGELFCRSEIQEKKVALTFDDGPNPNNTQEILNLLNRHHVKATFFMMGQNIIQHPDIAKAVLHNGHQIANHSYTHQRMVFKSPAFLESEINQTDEAIRAIGFKDEIVFRPPYGKKLFLLPLILARMNKTTVTWDAESEDTETQDPLVLESHVLSKVRPGSILLFHDGGKPKPGTLKAVENVILKLHEQNYEFVTVNELLENK